MATKDYTSHYQIKDFLVNNIAPKYLSTDEMNMAATGLFGYVTEALSVLGEDGLNMTSMVFKECFASAAENPESLYLMAAIYQLDQLFATPATLPFVMLVPEADIISSGTASNDFSVFYIDSDTLFSVDDKKFNLEFDVKITSKKTTSGYAHSVTYVMDHTSTISKVTNQYIPSKVFKYNGKNYIGMQINLRQMTKTEYNETIISNDKINVCSFDFDMGTDVQIAGFEAFYTAPNSTTEQQLTKRLENTAKLTTPFCFYTMPDDGVLRLEFGNDDRYFSPEFNSKLRVVVYTTTGSAGNAKKYTGTNINIEPTSAKYKEDNALIMLGQVSDASSGGEDKKTTDEFRDAVITAQSTVNSFSTESDLALYFKKMVDAGNTKIMFMKRRDDALIRLFNAFTLLTDSNNVVLPTNTADLVIEETDIDGNYPETYRSIIKAGKLLKYSSKFSGYLGIDSTIKMTDDLDKYEDDFLYTNPFLTILSSSPVNIGMYLNSVSDDLILDADKVNTNSFVQFMVSGLSVERNAVLGEQDYALSLKILPTSTTAGDCVKVVNEDTKVLSTDRTFVNPYDGKTYIDENLLKVVIFFEDNKVETCYKELELYEYDGTYYYFKTKITTDDYVSVNNKIKIVNSVYSLDDSKLCSEKFIPCKDIIANVRTFYKYSDEENLAHEYTSRGVAVGYTFTNTYTTSTNTMNLIVPLNSINAYLAYNQYVDASNVTKYNYKASSVPLIKANYVKDATRFKSFLQIFTTIYNYLNREIDLLTNNFDIDIKFYNTYGKSKNYVVGDDKVTLDKVNISLNFEIKPYYTTDTEALVSDVKEYILNYIRGEFDSTGNNAIYISNLIRKLEVNFASKIEYIIYKGINSYDLKVQKLEPHVTDDNISEYYSSMLSYVPEYINAYYKISGTSITPQIEITTL